MQPLIDPDVPTVPIVWRHGEHKTLRLTTVHF
jgi:hypothetical protein